jgi:uncharacterized protein (DUF433 family)
MARAESKDFNLVPSHEILISGFCKEEKMEWQERIIVDPAILVGKPVIKGTRLAVEFIVDLIAQGWSEQEILRNYPGISHADIQACLQYASAMLHAEKVYPLQVA